MKSIFNLKNKVIAITGGYGHIGKHVTNYLSKYGAIVYVLAKDKEKFDNEFGRKINIKFQYCDILDEQTIIESFKTIFNKHNKIDVLINNAAYTKGNSPEKMSLNDWQIGLEGTLTSVFLCIKNIIPYFKKNKKGKIINVSSMYGMIAPTFEIYNNFEEFTSQPNYGSSKAAVIQLTKYYASYLGKLNITVNTITPGPFPKKEIQSHKNFIKNLKKQTCLNKIGQPEDIIGAFVFLSSDSSNFITGHNLIVDGGWSVK